MSAPTNTTPINLTVATDQADAAAVEAVEQHHAQLAGELAALVETLLASASPGSITASDHDDTAAQVARQRLVEFCATQLMPHAEAEEEALYPAAAHDVRATLLVESMIAEHRMLRLLVDEVAATTRPVVAAALAMALRVLFDVHLAKENELILPLLAADPQVSLARILSGMHELLGESAEDCGCDQSHAVVTAAESGGGCRCGCGGHGGSDAGIEPEATVAATGGCGCG